MKQGILLLIALVRIVLFSSAVQGQNTNQEARISKREAKHILKYAQSASDQQNIAMYYRQKAERLSRKSKEQEELADAYANHTIFEPKTAYSGGLVLHCRERAAYYAKAASGASALAGDHEKVAQVVSTK